MKLFIALVLLFFNLSAAATIYKGVIQGNTKHGVTYERFEVLIDIDFKNPPFRATKRTWMEPNYDTDTGAEDGESCMFEYDLGTVAHMGVQIFNSEGGLVKELESYPLQARDWGYARNRGYCSSDGHKPPSNQLESTKRLRFRYSWRPQTLSFNTTPGQSTDGDRIIIYLFFPAHDYLAYLEDNIVQWLKFPTEIGFSVVKRYNDGDSSPTADSGDIELQAVD